jgi:DNA mismatch repair protein PMS2
VDVIEVSDDGSGVPKHSRPLLAMKHATSKIMSFDDLYTDVVIDGQVQLQASQLGFRGEALFSLVQVSQNLIICTRTESETMAQQIQFTRDGYLNPSSVKDVARKVGTTVAVVKLFEKLPVRRADMMKRLKAQRAKLFKLMQACEFQ